MRVMNLGTFDIIHYGHLSLLKFCKQLAGKDEFIVGLNSGSFVSQFKGHYPVMSWEERKKTLLSLPWVDRVVKNPQPKKSAGTVMLENGIELVVSGLDWLRKDLPKQWGVDYDWLDQNNISVCYFPFYKTKEISSSIIKERIRKQVL